MRAFLIVNLLFFTLAVTACTPLLIGGAGAGGYYVGSDERSVGTITDDALTTSAIKARYVNEKHISALNINVDTYDGVVTLYGSVSSSAAEARAVEIAQNTKGVRQVVSKLTVVPPRN